MKRRLPQIVRVKRVNTPPDTRAEVLRLAATCSLPDIARLTGLKYQTVYSLVAAAKVKPPQHQLGRPTPHPGPRLPPERDTAAPPGKPDPRRAAEEALIQSYLCNRRKPPLEIDELGFKLNGRRCGFDAVMRETNVHRRKWGMPVIDVNERWLPLDNA